MGVGRPRRKGGMVTRQVLLFAWGQLCGQPLGRRVGRGLATRPLLGACPEHGKQLVLLGGQRLRSTETQGEVWAGLYAAP